jgi:hypothetical protein
MSLDAGAYIEGPSKVALFPYDNRTLVVENFNDEAVSVNVIINAKVSSLRNLLTGETLQPQEEQSAPNRYFRGRYFSHDGATVFALKLPAHSYIGLEY